MAPQKVGKGEPPKGFSRLLWRAPIWIYRLGLGGLIRGRMLLLHHTGRKSGQPRQNVLEIVYRIKDPDRTANTYFVASGFGKKSDWYKNIRANPDVTITVGRTEIPVRAVPLPADESGQAIVDYSHRNPKAAKELMRLCGWQVDGSDEDYFIIGRDHVPFIALKPRSKE